MIESPFLSMLAMVPVAALAKAPVEDTTTSIIAAAIADFFMVFLPFGLVVEPPAIGLERLDIRPSGCRISLSSSLFRAFLELLR
ncbi:RDD domain containing protein [Mesorhizobium loti]|nr:RDD domain containing protein [Mesorhizobium loti]